MSPRRPPPRPLTLPWALAGALAGALGSAVGSFGCVVGPNPAFLGDESETFASDTTPATDDGGSDAESGPPTCPSGTLDCDGVPGCEASADDPSTCGSCSNACELAGQPLACADGRCIGSVELDIVDDAELDASAPDQNFGAEASLHVDLERRVLIGLPGLDQLPSSAEIESLVLHLHANPAGGVVDLYRVEAPWDEASVTEADAPAIDGAPLLTWAPKVGDNGLELVDLLGAWQQGAPKHSLALVVGADAGPNPDPTELDSSEGPIPPTLVMTLAW